MKPGPAPTLAETARARAGELRPRRLAPIAGCNSAEVKLLANAGRGRNCFCAPDGARNGHFDLPGRFSRWAVEPLIPLNPLP